MGFPLVGDPFKGDAHGVFFTAECIDPTTKQRSYVGNTYLKGASGKGNLKIITKAVVSRIILADIGSEGILGTGVEFIRNESNTIEVIEARKEVILSAGALESPEILELSGIGDAKICRELGVPCFIDNQSMGANLQNHACVGMNFEVEASCTTMDGLGRGDPESLRFAGEKYAQGEGPMASSNMFAHCQLPFPKIASEIGKKDLQCILQIQEPTSNKTNPEFGGVVDEKSRVYGCKNLRICDASVLPLLPRANPQSTVYAIAEAASDFLKETWYP